MRGGGSPVSDLPPVNLAVTLDFEAHLSIMGRLG